MRQWIHRETPLKFGCRIAASIGDPSMGVFMKDDRKEQGKCFIRDGMEDLRDVVHGIDRLRFRDFRAEHEERIRPGGRPLEAADVAILPFTMLSPLG